jgi:fucose 4-O-acetylase-like acetyltransferase
MLVTDENRALDWILLAKGIGIILVVIGHFAPASSPAYWVEARRIIYTFHMPLFFFLSGWLYQHGKYSYRTLVINKVQRLMYPFVSIAILFFLIKFAAGVFVHLDAPVDLDSIQNILVNPVKSYMPLLWFVHALFLIFMVYPLARHFLGDSALLLMFLAINLSVEGTPPFIGNSVHYLPFFIAGCVTRTHQKALTSWLDSSPATVPILLGLFAAACFFLQPDQQLASLPEYLLVFTAGISGTLLTIKTSHAIAPAIRHKGAQLLVAAGFYSMTIYLFHTLFESAARIVLLQVLRQMELPFELVALTAIIAGLVFPLGLEKYVLRRYALTRKWILGIR